MGSPTGHEDLVRQFKELEEERDRFTRNSLADIFDCFSSLSNARQIIGEGLVKSARLISMSEAIQVSLNTTHFETACWKPYQEKLQSLKELVAREKIQRKKTINAKVLKMLRTDIKTATALRLIGHLKEQTGDGGLIPLEGLPSIFLQCRETFITDYILNNDPMNCQPDDGFKRACFIMRKAVHPVLDQYCNAFTDVPPISSMLCRRFAWFMDYTVGIIGRISDLKMMATIWDELVELECSFSVYNASFFPFIVDDLISKAVTLAVKSMEKAVAMFIGSLGKTVVPDGATMKSVPAFIMLVNSMNQMFQTATVFCPPQIIAPFEAAVQDKLLHIEQALRSESMLRIRDLYETEFRPYLTDTFARLIELSK